MNTTTTCIVALKDKENDVIYLGGDSAGVSHLFHTVRADTKVFTKTSENGITFGFGFTSSFRMGQLIQYELKVPSTEGIANLHEYMVTKFVPAIRECFKTGGYTSTKDGKESGGTFIVAVQGRIFKVDSDFQVGENVFGYDACGCGEEFALGSLFTSTTGLSSLERVNMALSAAVQFSGGVMPPFNIITV
jgi:hypothetical protein